MVGVVLLAWLTQGDVRYFNVCEAGKDEAGTYQGVI
jgi:hypothetical protein